MILYNVTVNIDNEVCQEWLHWMKTAHMLDVLNTGMFKTAKIFRLLDVEQSEGTTTYAVQYFADSLTDVKHYQRHFAPALRAESEQKFGNRAVSFRTLMEEL